MSCNSDNDVEDLLEKSIDEKYSKKNVDENKQNKCPFNFKNKQRYPNKFLKSLYKIEEKVKYNPLLLPEGWVRLFHESGMFFYCHVSTKVVTWSMPYQLQTEPPRYHRVPVRSIPCLSYKFMKNEERLEILKDNSVNKVEESKENENSLTEQSREIGNVKMQTETIKEKEELRNVCEITVTIPAIKKDIEDGEIESSDDDSNKDYDKSSSAACVLPKQYQIDTLNHKSSRQKHSSISESSKVVDCLENPAKRRKFTSSEEPPSEKLQQPEEPVNQVNQEIPSFEDLSAKLLEPDQLKNYGQKLFTYVEETKYVPRFFFVKKRPNKPNTNNATTESPPKPNEPAPSNIEATVSVNCTEKLKVPNKNMFIELAGRNFSCILNMYCQNAFGVTPTFTSSSSLSGIQDFEVSCEISGNQYAIGEGRTKKIAKQKAVAKALEILVPGFSNMINIVSDNPRPVDICQNPSTGASTSTNVKRASTALDRIDGEIYAIFDNIDITDPRVLSYTTKLNSMTPYNMLIECMNRHCVLDSHLVSTITKQNRHNVYKLQLGDKEVQANCENKREGRQLASQYMLAKLHPHIQRWGGILRLYGPDSKPVKRFDMHEMQNLLLEDRGGVKSNLINLLRKKMLELNEEWQSTDKSYAKFNVQFDNIPIIVFHPDSKDQSK